MEGSNTNNQIFSLLLSGCELAKKLEDDLYNNNLFVLPSSSSSPLIISKKCEEIIRMFSIAKEQLDSMHPSPLNHHLLHNQHPQEMVVVDVGLEGFQGKGKGKEVAEGEGDEREGKPQYRMLELGMSSSSGQQKNRRRSSRNDDQGNRRMKMPAPQIGNTEMPPDDGFTWRKYGQKEILNARFPRSYYRCTHQKLYDCQAKKQVQRLDDDPNFFEILYRGDHTCHMSNTAPTVPPLPPPPLPPSSQTVQFIPHQQITTVPSPLDWLSVDLTIPSSEGAYNIFHHHHQQQQLLHSVSSSDSILTNFADVGPSTTVRSHHHQGGQGGDRTVDLLNNNQPLVDWSDMFNSGSSGSNSMEVIFSSSTNDDIKWETNRDIKD